MLHLLIITMLSSNSFQFWLLHPDLTNGNILMTVNENSATDFKEIRILLYESRSCRNQTCVMITF